MKIKVSVAILGLLVIVAACSEEKGNQNNEDYTVAVTLDSIY